MELPNPAYIERHCTVIEEAFTDAVNDVMQDEPPDPVFALGLALLSRSSSVCGGAAVDTLELQTALKTFHTRIDEQKRRDEESDEERAKREKGALEAQLGNEWRELRELQVKLRAQLARPVKGSRVMDVRDTCVPSVANPKHAPSDTCLHSHHLACAAMVAARVRRTK
jgi:hypothetical protein